LSAFSREFFRFSDAAGTSDIHCLSKVVRKTIKKPLLFIMINLRQFTLLEETPREFVK